MKIACYYLIFFKVIFFAQIQFVKGEAPEKRINSIIKYLDQFEFLAIGQSTTENKKAVVSLVKVFKGLNNADAQRLIEQGGRVYRGRNVRFLYGTSTIHVGDDMQIKIVLVPISKSGNIELVINSDKFIVNINEIHFKASDK